MKGQVNRPLVGSMASSHIFKIMFVNQGKVYEVYARKVSQGRLFGFIEVEELVFGERSTVVLDPGEDRIKSEFTGVKCSALEAGGNVAQVPMSMYQPAGDPGSKK